MSQSKNFPPEVREARIHERVGQSTLNDSAAICHLGFVLFYIPRAPAEKRSHPMGDKGTG